MGMYGWHDNSLDAQQIDFSGAKPAVAAGPLILAGTSDQKISSSLPDTKFIQAYLESKATSGDNRGMYLRYYMNGINATGGECLKAGTVLGAAIGTARGEQASIEVSSAGYVTGFACGLDGLLEVANSAVPSGGTYCAGQSQIFMTGASSSLSAAASHALHRFSVIGGNATAEATIKNAFNFDVANCAGSGAGNMISVGTSMSTVIGTIRIVINGAIQYIPYYGHEGHA